ncbi:helix-turn-helix domain-containing protein [Roseibium album]|uniref:helix-turn-helix domain-containing protein n=1 Tax=Roseibium album TaxID=311410 RepID=UPI0024932E1E|nr:helix-turn-helix transcriptional regulator [Roseibium album]
MNEIDARTRIANWLKEALDATSITQDDLAREIKKRHINLDQSKISRIINKGRGMSAEELLATAEILKVPLPTIGTSKPLLLASDAVGDEPTGFHPELSELALEITKDLEKNEHDGDLKDEDYIQASALIYNMLRSAGAWHPKLFQESKKLMAQVKRDRGLSNLPFTDYVKSVAIYYQTLARAEKSST